MHKDYPPSYLIVSPSWVGDLVMAQSLFKVLKYQTPTAYIDLLAPHWMSSLIARMPEVRYVHPHQLEHGKLQWQARRELGQSLRSQQYDQAILLANSFKSALIPYFANIPKRTGFLGEMRYGLVNDVRPLNKLILRRTVDQFIALGLPAGDKRQGQLFFPPRLSPAPASTVLSRLNLENTRPILALCAGAEYGAAKRWLPENYAAVARQKISEGWQVWLFGSGKDVAISEQIRHAAGEGCYNLAGETNLGEAVDLLALAQAVISNDSGLMHVAAALDKPLIAIYGSSDPRMTPPLKPDAKIIYQALSCSPCFKRECPRKHLRCLTEISPTQVLDALANLSLSA